MTRLVMTPKVVTDDRVSIEGAAFKKPSTGTWIETNFMPSSSNVRTLGAGGRDAETGILQINLCAPLGSALTPALKMLTVIKARFYAGMSTTYQSRTVTVQRVVASPSFPTDDAIKLPVSIYWRSLVPRSTS